VAAPALQANFVGEVHRSRGDTWIEIEGRNGTMPLTDGFNGDKPKQQQIAAELTAFFRQPVGSTYRGTFGSRWRALFIPALTVSFAIGIWMAAGQSLTFVRRGHPPALAVEDRRWPLPARRYSFELSQIAAVEIGPHPQSRFPGLRKALHLVLRTARGERVVLGMVRGRGAERVRARVDAFLREA
jgi:hypothetical protein